MTQLEYYKCVNNRYLATIDLSNIKSSENKSHPLFICLLDRSGSMGGNVKTFSKFIKYTGNIDYYKNQDISAGGGTNLYVGLVELEKILDDYIKSNKNIAIRLLTISDGDVGTVTDVYKKIDELIQKIKNKLIINSHAVRYFTSDSPPDTKGLCTMLKLNNITIGKLIDIKTNYNNKDSEDDEVDNEKNKIEDNKEENNNEENNNEKTAKRIAELFLNDELDEHYKIISEQKNIYDSPWNESSSELLLKKGKNFIWCENINQIQLKNSLDEKIEINNISKGEINSKNYLKILQEKFIEIKKKAMILKIMNNNESNKELNNLISNIDKFEKEINSNSSNNNYFSKQLQTINETNFGNQNSDELANALKKIDEEIGYEKENEKLKKDISTNELFLCPKCLKKVPLFISFKIENNNNDNIIIKYLCSCDKKFQEINLEELLNKWKDNKNIYSKCNSHKKEGKYCLKCNKWLCPDCIIVHEDIKSSHKELITKNELLLNNKCNEHNKKNKIGFCCTCYEEICSTCAGFFNDGHIKYTNKDKWKYIFDNFDFKTMNQFEDIVDKMNKKILDYKKNQLKKLDDIINEIKKLKENIENKYNLIKKNNKNLTKFYQNLLKTFIVYENIPTYILNENTSKFQFNRNFFIIENESNNTFSEIARATLETFKTCNLYQLNYYPEIKKDTSLYELNTKEEEISSIIQLKDGDILTGHYNTKKILFYDYNFKKLNENNIINTPGYVTCLCELDNKILSVGMYSPNNIMLYDINNKENGIYKEIKKLEGHSGKITSIIDLNENYLISGGQSTYEIFFWEKKNNYNLIKQSRHSSNINCIIKLDRKDYFASCSDDKTIRIWQNTNNINSFSCNNPVKQIIQLNNKKIVCVDSGRTLYIYNENSYSQERSISSQHNSNINKLLLLKDSRIISCSDDNRINIYEPQNYKCLNYSFSFMFNNNSKVKTIFQTENHQIISGDSKIIEII